MRRLRLVHRARGTFCFLPSPLVQSYYLAQYMRWLGSLLLGNQILNTRLGVWEIYLRRIEDASTRY